jgi:lambda family phage portal protein
MIQSLNLETQTFAEIRQAQAAARAREDRRHDQKLKRSYDAARINRLNRDWSVVNTGINFEMRKNLRILRARSRNLARNNDYVKKFLSMVRNNVAGPAGIRLQARAMNQKEELDQILNRTVERAWTKWSHKENASLSGRLSWTAIQRKAIGTIARDGECLIRMMAASNPFGFALKCISVDWLDETFNQRLTNGNRVIMSVEIDQDDRAVAYWLTPPPADYQFLDNTVRSRTRIPAEEIIHIYLMDDENSDDDCQTRGVPWVHTAMARLRNLGGYEEAEVIAARIGASKMGFFKEETPDADSYTGDDDEDEKTPLLMDSASPGQFGVIPAGYDFKEWNPQHPNTSYGPFVKSTLRGVAAGLDVTYFSLAEDLEGVNYSSARIGLLSERDVWRALQNFLIEHLNRTVFLAWLKSAMLTGALKIRVSDYERLTEPQWQPRGWRWVDPAKEVQANIEAINNGLDTRTDVIAEQGGDFEETITTLANEQKLIEAKGVKLAEAKPQPSTPGADGGETQPAET